MKAPNRVIRVPDELWWATQRITYAQGETPTTLIVRFLEAFVARNQHRTREDFKRTATPQPLTGPPSDA